jgi:signal transduction histidine kinase
MPGIMKNVSIWIVLLVALSTGGVCAVHWKGIEDSDRRISRVQPIYERQGLVDAMTLDLEKYRRTSSIFRKMEPSEMAQTKAHLRAAFSKDITALDQLEATADERKLTMHLDEQLNHFLEASAKLEPQLFLKDAYHDPAIVDMHDGMIKSLAQLAQSARARIDTAGAKSSGETLASMRMIATISIAIVLLVLLIPIRDYFLIARPLRRLKEYALKLSQDKGMPQPKPGLKGEYGEIEGVLNELVLTVESQRKDRHKFIQDIVDDLSSPLAMLKKGRSLASSEADEATQLKAADSVRRGLALLSGSLDDLGDILNLNRLESQLEERVVDLTELVSDTVRELTGGPVSKSLSVVAPPMPVWVLLDAKRFERILVQILSKVAANGATRSSKVQVTVSQPHQGGFRGAEILVQEMDSTGAKARLAGNGPEQDLARHWIGDNGFGMALVHKIVKAHGGTVVVSGVAGSNVQFRIRLPHDRLGSGLLSPSQVAPQPEPTAEAPRLGLEVAPLTHAPMSKPADAQA